MAYTVQQLAELSGVSARTLRYYDEIGLLKPARGDNGYRLYGGAAVDRLQQVLFFRTLGLRLEEIARLLDAPGFDRPAALRRQLCALRQQKAQLERLIQTVDSTLRCLEGGMQMDDVQKFEGLKQQLLAQNERAYGSELRERYGAAQMARANEQFRALPKARFDRAQALEQAIRDTLRAAVQDGDPAGPLAQKTCALHAEWLQLYWPAGSYSRAAQRDMGALYTGDARFRAYYDAAAPGAAAFFQQALELYCAQA